MVVWLFILNYKCHISRTKDQEIGMVNMIKCRGECNYSSTSKLQSYSRIQYKAFKIHHLDLYRYDPKEFRFHAALFLAMCK